MFRWMEGAMCDKAVAVEDTVKNTGHIFKYAKKCPST